MTFAARVSALLIMLVFLAFPAMAEDSRVVIYSSCEEYRNEHFRTRLAEQFPELDIIIEYMPTGNQAAKLMAEGTNTQADIIYDMEYGYMPQLEHLLADLTDLYDFSIYREELVPQSRRYLPEYLNSGAIIVNTQVLEDEGLPLPQSYEDLLKPEYEEWISMPNPKSSGTGYMFLKNLVNVWGEDAAFDYFDELSYNVLQFTSSGSGPVNALVQGEAAIGLGMIGQAVVEINKGAPLQILFFEEGCPYTAYGCAMIDGRQTDAHVKAVFDFFYTTLTIEDKQFFPESIYKDRTFEMENYPQDLVYGDMSNNTYEEKSRLLADWEY